MKLRPSTQKLIKLTDIRLDQMDPRDLQRYCAILADFTHGDGRRLDSNETAILTRQIEFVRAKVFQVQYASLLSISFLPLATDIPQWASNVIQVVYDQTGQAQIVANGADDVPRVGATASEQSLKVISVAASYGWSLMDLRAAIGTGVPLSDLKARMGRRAVDAALDEILATGSLSTNTLPKINTGLAGFINNSAVPVFTTTAGSWASASSNAIIADMSNMILTPEQTTKQIYDVTDVVMAPAKYDLLATTPRATGTDTTILEFLQKTNPRVTFSRWHRLTGAGSGGKDRVVAYCKSPEVVEGIVPILFEQLPPQVRNFETSVILHARCGGVDFHQAAGAVYMDPTT
jgi:hypothetical protein